MHIPIDAATASFEGPWENIAGYAPTGFRLHEGKPQLRVIATGDEDNPGSVVFTLPETHWPVEIETAFIRLGPGDGGALRLGALDIHPDGTVEYLGKISGAPGATGGPGSAGASSQWLVGTGTPSSGSGNDTDFYLDDATGNVYQKLAGSWSLVANIAGPAGTAGDGLLDTAGTWSVRVDGSTIEISSDILRVKAGGITPSHLSFDPATQAELDAHVTDATDAHDASAISIVDSGAYYTSTDVEGALQEAATMGGGSGDVATDVIWDAKGDLAVGSGANAADNLPVGSDGKVLMADAASTLGVKWETAPGGAPSGAAGGALDGSYPNPGIAASVAGAGLAEASNVLSVNVDGSTIEISADTLRVKDGGITSAKIADGTIAVGDLAFDPATQTELDAHITDASDAHDASAISVADAGSLFTATDVEGVLQEIGGSPLVAREFELLVFGDESTVTAGDGKRRMMIPSSLDGANLTGVAAGVLTASSSGALSIQVRNETQGADMLSTPITIDQGETTSYTAAAAVIDTANDDVASGDFIRIDVDAAGTGAIGLYVVLRFGAGVTGVSVWAKVSHNAAQSIATSTFTVLAFNTEQADTHAIHDTSTNNSRLTCQVAGTYLVGAQIAWGVNSTGARIVEVLLNGATVAARVRTPATNETEQSVSILLTNMSVGDYVEVRVWQDSGSALDVASASAYSPRFWMVKQQ